MAELNQEYLRRMEDVLALYEKPLSEAEPVRASSPHRAGRFGANPTEPSFGSSHKNRTKMVHEHFPIYRARVRTADQLPLLSQEPHTAVRTTVT